MAGSVAGRITDRSRDAQEYQASGLNLVIAAIVYWNSTYMADAVAYLRSVTIQRPITCSPIPRRSNGDTSAFRVTSSGIALPNCPRADGRSTLPRSDAPPDVHHMLTLGVSGRTTKATPSIWRQSSGCGGNRAASSASEPRWSAHSPTRATATRPGIPPYIEQLDAQRALLRAELALVQTEVDELNAIVALYQAMGGPGFSNDPPPG